MAYSVMKFLYCIFYNIKCYWHIMHLIELILFLETSIYIMLALANIYQAIVATFLNKNYGELKPDFRSIYKYFCTGFECDTCI